MSETPEDEQTAEAAAAEATGHPAVDAVLASLERLEELPVGEHPPIFEEAHEALRSALAQARDGAPSEPHKH